MRWNLCWLFGHTWLPSQDFGRSRLMRCHSCGKVQ